MFSTSFYKLAAAGAAAFILVGTNIAAADRGGQAVAPPRKCEIRLAAWCIYESDITIQHKPAQGAEYHSVWTLWGSYWRQHPAMILEPNGCRSGISNEMRLVTFDGRFRWQNKTWNSAVVRLKTDGTCDLRLLSPTVATDPDGAAFSATLSLIQACQTDECSGPTVGERIWPAVKRQ